MKILHAFSNWKWTGPAEPAVRLAGSLLDRHEVEFACGSCPFPDLENRVEREARELGLPLLGGLRLRKHFDPVSGARDLAGLIRTLRSRDYDVVHTHLLNDHLLAGAAARRSGRRSVIVRTVYGGPDLAPRFRTALAFRRLTDGVVAVSEAALEVVRLRTRIPDERLFVVEGAVDVTRFDPERLAPLRAAMRQEFGFGDDQVVAGIVARIQRHRRFDLLLEAFAAALKRAPELRLVLVGRGTHQDGLVEQPVKRMGLERKVVLAGYREGPRYESLLAGLDLGLFLVPGSDGSCRAARELAAAGLPLIVTARPPLTEIARPEVNGLVVEETVQALADALVALASNRDRRRALGAGSRRLATQLFSLPRQVARIESVYEQLLALRDGGPSCGS